MPPGGQAPTVSRSERNSAQFERSRTEKFEFGERTAGVEEIKGGRGECLFTLLI